MLYQFCKMHGLGNDFVIVDQRLSVLPLSTLVIQRLSHRRFGIGCDQFIVLETARSPQASIFMRIFNADGMEVEACGNASRCVIAYLHQHAASNGDHPQHFIIETKAAVLQGHIQSDGQIAVNMGQPSFNWQDIPLTHAVDTLFLPIQVLDLPPPAAVNIGNPHMVFFVSNINDVDLERIGSELSHHNLFTNRTNVEIAEILSRHTIRMRVWERGVGITLACATGACASVAVGIKQGMLDSPVTVQLDGGNLVIDYRESLLMVGPAALSFTGSFNIQDFIVS